MHRFRSDAASGFSRTSEGTWNSPPLRYWKPIQTGIEKDDDTQQVQWLGACGADEILDRGVRLRRPVSPHLAAKLSGYTIDLDALIESVASHAEDGRWIGEGAGGALVPINESAVMTDAMIALGLPVLIVARSTLGTINHTLLTIEALRTRSLDVAGVVMVGQADGPNREAIEFYGQVPVVGELPLLEPLTPEALKAWARTGLDPDGALRLHQ